MSEPISTAAQCRALDADVIDGLGVPGVALMEVASRGVALALLERWPDAHERGVLVVTGAGNNGGDGFGCARWLHTAGVPVRIWALSDRLAGDAAVMRDAVVKQGVPFVDGPGGEGIVVDAVFGTGLAREVSGAYATALERLASLAVPVVAVDLPSGLHADTGAVLGMVLPADLTVTFGRLKQAFFTPGARHCGQVQRVDIGVHRTRHASAHLTERTDLTWPDRDVHAFKNRLGHLAVVAGSEAMAGAAVLSCLGAVRSGVGLVTLLTVPEALPRLTGLPASVMVRTGTLVESLERARDYDAIAVGPGVGGGHPLGPHDVAALAALWAADRPVVFDADALVAHDGPAGPAVVVTPHPGEAGRLLGRSAGAVESDRFGAARDLARSGATVLLKGRHTLIAHGDGVFVNPTGAPTLATAGSGDVLTGLLGGLLARGVAPIDATRLAAWVHGRAGERLHEQRAEGWIADDIAGALPGAIAELV
ncbi:MAG: NAD(P)H-hydrate dehydratase [Myxococcota bacterium]